MTREEALAKAIKLLKLSGSPNANEAGLAAQKAQEIMTKFDIQQMELRLDGQAEEPEEEIEDFTYKSALDPVAPGKRNIAGWRINLSSSVARLNNCRIIITTGYGISLVGRPSQVETVRYLFAMIAVQVTEISEREGKGCGKTWRNNFRLGMVHTINTRLWEAKRTAEAELRKAAEPVSEIPNNLALVRVNTAIEKLKERDKQVDDFVEKKYGKAKHQGSNVQGDHSAFAAGRAAGHKVNIGGKARGVLGA